MNSSFMKWLERNIALIIVVAGVAIIFLPRLLSLPAPAAFFDVSSGGPVGDAIGGITAPIIGLVSIILLCLTLKAQKDADYHSQLENRIFQLIKLHIENVDGMHSKYGDDDLNGQEVFKLIHSQVSSCANEIRPFIDLVPESDLFSDQFAPQFDKLGLKVEKKQFALLDIAFNIVYIGVGRDTFDQLRSILLLRYNEHLVDVVLGITRLRPVKSAEKTYAQWMKWSRFSSEKKMSLLPLFRKSYEEMSEEDRGMIKESFDLLHKGTVKKFYWGHQFRMSHYYRHLYMIIEYITNEKILTDDEKYGYVKILRAQLSTTEQVLLMANSVTQLGGQWELFRNDDRTYISTYHLIKNIPQPTVFGVDYRKIYPRVKYEIGAAVGPGSREGC